MLSAPLPQPKGVFHVFSLVIFPHFLHQCSWEVQGLFCAGYSWWQAEKMKFPFSCYLSFLPPLRSTKLGNSSGLAAYSGKFIENTYFLPFQIPIFKKAPAFYRYKSCVFSLSRKDLPRFILSSPFAPAHVAIFYPCWFLLQGNKGEQQWKSFLPASPRARGTQPVCRKENFLPLPNCLKIQTHFSSQASFHLSLSHLSPLECQRRQIM